jgi:hypothetical protein
MDRVGAHFPDDHRPVAHIQLNAMITDAQTAAKSECTTEPFCRLIYIWIR